MEWTDLNIGDNKYKGFNIAILLDDESESPRVWDNLGHMICFHGKYNLGDNHKFKDPDELDKFLKKVKREGGIYLPLYLYDHSGLTMATAPFSCPWDSGQVGYIYATGEEIRKWFMCERVSKNIRERAYKALENEVGLYSRYLEGDIYGYVITDADDDTELVDSCWGIYGIDIVRQMAMNEAISLLNEISQG